MRPSDRIGWHAVSVAPFAYSAGVQGGSWGVHVVPQFQQSKSSTRYFCVHHEITGSPHTTQSAPHHPHSKTNSTPCSSRSRHQHPVRHCIAMPDGLPWNT